MAHFSSGVQGKDKMLIFQVWPFGSLPVYVGWEASHQKPAWIISRHSLTRPNVE